jgi:tRNA U34 2-thiouridine synthase MnmA/TrmU
VPKAVALFSGGLDSTLAILVLREQGIDIEALNIRTTFDCCKAPAGQTAHELGVRLTVLSVGDDYVDLLREPSHGYGKAVNPCVDCRIYMARMAKRLMEDVGACVVITGEIVGQRPMSQKKRDLALIESRSGLKGRLLRPLSAKLLPATIPEEEGLIDRQRLHAFEGRSRSKLIELAQRYGLEKIPQPSTGCALTEVSFAPRVRDLMDHNAEASRWDFELLNVGRHIRLDEHTKAVVGRNASENASLELFFRRASRANSAYLHPESFLGPDVLVVGRITEKAIQFAGALVLRYSKKSEPQNALIRVEHGDATTVLRAEPIEQANSVRPL